MSATLAGFSVALIPAEEDTVKKTCAARFWLVTVTVEVPREPALTIRLAGFAERK